MAGIATYRTFSKNLQDVSRRVLDTLLPPQCLLCPCRTVEAGALCPACWAKLDVIDAPLCNRLGTPFAFDPGGELLHQTFAPGPIATFDLPVPGDPSFAGIRAATQALHFGGTQPFALSNAQDLVVGFAP